LALLCLDHPDGWRNKEAWAWYERVVIRELMAPRDRKWGFTGPRFTTVKNVRKVMHDLGIKEDRWFVYDDLKNNVAAGTRRDGYTTKEEAQEVCKDLQDNREVNTAYWPF
jgi:hypothetical protein